MSGAPSERDATATVVFLPNRLNLQPIIVRGLTADELWVTVGLSAACGLVLGVALAALTGRIALAPTLILITIAGGVFVGGSVLRRHKRGRPETWLYRQMQWRVTRRLPALSTYLGSGDLILRSGYWTTRRATRR